MIRIIVIALMGLGGYGLVLVRSGQKKTGAFLFGLALFLFLGLLPWKAIHFLMLHNRHFRLWAARKMPSIKEAWFGLSAVAAALGGLIIGFACGGKRKPWWSEPAESSGVDRLLRKSLERHAKDATFMGLANGGKEVSLGTVERQRHIQVVGPTRSGKSQLLFALTGQDMRQGMPVFFMEAKGDHDDFDQFLRLASVTGRVADVRYFNPHDDRSMTFNPIRMVPGQDATAIANQIARAIGREPTSSGEGQDYYRSVDYAKIQNMAEIFCQTGKQFTLRDCFCYFSFPQAREKVFASIKDRRLVGIASQQFKDAPDSTALTSALRPWTTGSLGALLNSYSPKIKLEEIFDAGRLAYFAVPIGYLQVLANPLGRMIISGLLSVAAFRQKAGKKPKAASVVIDEFAEFATPVFASFISTVGSAQLWTTLSHQDRGQLKKVRGMDADAFASAVYNNTSGCKICFRTPDPEDAEFWAGSVGTYRTTDDTERVERGWLGLTKGTGEMSRRTVEQFMVHPNALKNLKHGSALFFAPGKEPCLARSARVFRLPFSGPLPELPSVEPRFEDGLELDKAVSDPGSASQYDQQGDLPK